MSLRQLAPEIWPKMFNYLFSKIHDFVKFFLLKQKRDILQYSAKTVTPIMKLHKLASKQILKTLKTRYCTSFIVNYFQRYSKMLLVVLSKFSNFKKNCYHVPKPSYQNVWKFEEKICKTDYSGSRSVWQVPNMQYLPFGVLLWSKNWNIFKKDNPVYFFFDTLYYNS